MQSYSSIEFGSYKKATRSCFEVNDHLFFITFRSDRPVPVNQLDNEVFDANTAPPRLKSPSQVRTTRPVVSTIF
jgi:hypothetical protein